jgi:hypothetical protein
MTQVKWGKQLALAAILFVFGAVAFWKEYKQKPAEEAKEEQAKKLFPIKDTALKGVWLTDGVRTFSIVCSDFDKKLCKPGDNSHWELESPSKLKADDANVNALLSSLSQVAISDTIDLKDETPEKRAALLKEYGLDPATRMAPTTRKVHIRTGTTDTVVYFGVTHPIGDGIFAGIEKFPAGQEHSGKIDETKVVLVPSYFKSNLEHDLTYWRDKKLLTVGAHEIDSFTLDGTKAYVVGTRKDGQWQLRAGQSKAEDLSGDIENVDSLLTAAAYLSAKSFVSDSKDDPAAKAALKGAKPVVKLTLRKEKGTAKEQPEPITLTFYQKGDAAKPAPKNPKDKKAAPASGATKLYVTVSNLDPLFELEPYAKDRIDKELKELRLAKLITSMERFGAKRLEFSGEPIGSPALVLTNANGKWINDGDKADVDSEKVQNLLDKLSGNRIKDFLSGSSIPTGEDKGLTLAVGDEKTKAKRELVFWKAGDKLYGRDLLAGRKEAFVLDTTMIPELPWDRAAFKKGAPSAVKAPVPPPGSAAAGKPPGLPQGLPPNVAAALGAKK